MKYTCTLFLVFIWINVCVAQEYLLTTYEWQAESTAYSAYVEKIDLALKAVTAKVKLCDGGLMHDRKPHFFQKNGHKYYAVFVQYGFSSGSPDARKVSYFILDDSLNIIKKVEMPHALLMGVNSVDDNTLQILMYKNGIINTPMAPQYQFNDIFDLQPNNKFSYAGSPPFPIGRFEYFVKINMVNPHNLFSAYVPPNDFWLLRLNDDHTAIVDSFLVNSDTLAPSIFAYHPKTDKLYQFRFNAVNQSGIPEIEGKYGQDWFKLELLIYNPATFKLLEIRPLPDCPPDKNPGKRIGIGAEIYDDYMVYYFFQEEKPIAGYRPAMLFIFDTRTNQATWLRVGWR